MIQWVDDTGSKHVDMDVRSNDEQEAQKLLIDHREFMENEATVSVVKLFSSRANLVLYFTDQKCCCQSNT